MILLKTKQLYRRKQVHKRKTNAYNGQIKTECQTRMMQVYMHNNHEKMVLEG